jgi:PQQ-dependent dehydrogenase (s-GDH family)
LFKTSIFYLLIFTQFINSDVFAQSFTSRLVCSNNSLQNPWEITWGPDNFIWCTQRTGKIVSRINPTNGTIQNLVTISNVFTSTGQDGLLGLALHPNLLTTEPYVYLAYTYLFNAGGNELTRRRARIVRYTYNQNPSSPLLSNELILLDNLPASNDHNSGRLKITQDLKLLYTIGDQGKNQFGNKCDTIRSQYVDFLEGKILRINLDGTAPMDNPFACDCNSLRRYIFSLGHRNPQGIVQSSTGKIYSCEHGPKTDDECNLIVAGGNYGWPNVAGKKDGKYYRLGKWRDSTNCAGINFNDYVDPPPRRIERTFGDANFIQPIKTLFTVDTPYTFFTGSNAYLYWPTIAPSSIDIYETGPIAVFNNCLLVTSLKQGRLYRLQLDATGNSVVGDTATFCKSQNRYRDICFSADKTKIYIACDNTGQTSGPTQGSALNPVNPGNILEFSLLPEDLKKNIFFKESNFSKNTEFLQAVLGEKILQNE